MFLRARRSSAAAGSILRDIDRSGSWRVTRRRFATAEKWREDKQMSILYGTQSGTAGTFACMMDQELKDKGWNSKVINLGEYEPADLRKEPAVGIVISCFGRGEPPDNARAFHKWIMSPERDAEGSGKPFKGLRYALFGLGNSGCAGLWGGIYQAVGRQLDARLQALGAEPLCSRGEGDDHGSLEEDWKRWTTEKFYPVLEGQPGNTAPVLQVTTINAAAAATAAVASNSVPASETPQSKPQTGAKPLKWLPAGSYIATTTQEEHEGRGTYDLATPFHAALTENRELCAAGYRVSCRQLSFDIGNTGITYQPGDYLGVWPENDAQLVERLAARLNAKPSAAFELDPHAHSMVQSRMPGFFPRPCTVVDALTRFCDITAIPKRGFVKSLANLATDDLDKARLLDLAAMGSERQEEFARRMHHKTVLQILTKYPSIKIDFDTSLQLLPPMKVRYYSISSSQSVHPNTVELTVGRSLSYGANGTPYSGLCSNYLRDRQCGGKDRVAIFVKPSAFRLPADDQTPIVMIGGGTGIAPFRSFWEERVHRATALGRKVGPNVLFFGCNHREKDFLHREELEKLASSKLMQLHTAFSHDQEERIYVQHVMAQQAALLWDLVHHQSAAVYICGHVALGQGVEECLLRVFMQQGGQTLDKAQDYLHRMLENGRYHVDIFS